jgi:predicted PolB exonuclease-like 3'-5' exonuclease
MSTQPPLFTKVEDPLDVDVWLRVIESKFPLLTGDCPDDAKVCFAAQQLRGPAPTWWDHFRAMLPADHEVSWEEFKTAFRGHHILAGILDRKLNEFLALNQGTHMVLQYAQAFNDLCQYEGYHADSDEKKRDRFRRGLNTKLRERLNTVRADSFNELVNLAISQEDCNVAHQAEKKRKEPMAAPYAQAQRFKIVSHNQSRGFQQHQADG